MNTKYNMIRIKGEIKTTEIESCQYNRDTKKWDVKFKSGKLYSYGYNNVEKLTNPIALNPKLYRISSKIRELFDVEAIYVFEGKRDKYWHICFGNGSERDYSESELQITESVLNDNEAVNVLEYLKQIAELSDIKNETNGVKLLKNRMEKISFVGEQIALAKYLKPSLKQKNRTYREYIPIFPFGCNNSQYQAVKNAMENQISVIQGPPGTGKTQTILNIIANILIQDQTVQIVSNNNAATENVYEKLASHQYNLGFVVAVLGNSDNKKNFLAHQNEVYPDFSSWQLEGDADLFYKKIYEKSARLKEFFDIQEKLAGLKHELSEIETELRHFEEYVDESDVHTDEFRFSKKLSSKSWMALWQECEQISRKRDKIGIVFKIKAFFQHGILNRKFFRQDIAKMITTFQAMYYQKKRTELSEQISRMQRELNEFEENPVQELCSQSMAILKGKLAEKYQKSSKRRIFKEEDLWKEPQSVLKEYPVVLSTTFSSKSSLNQNTIYDYLIMDEASQVDIATGALALSCARNVVIVGDTKQLPNVVTGELKDRAKTIFNSFHLPDGYQFTKSFLQSILEVMPDVTQTLLREHYRCHPKIIDFCNQKFYHGELIIMTEDHGEKDVLSVIKTVAGNHERDHYSQRQIDVIKKEVLSKYDLKPEETGIIAPYKNQVNALHLEIKEIDSATVHKFQGREKENIIISTVDDEISDFADDPYLINVAVSRAKRRLMLVVTGNEQNRESNTKDLVDYIEYHDFSVTDSRIYSIFDYLYKQYTEERKKYLRRHRRVSEYDSENLMQALLDDILKEDAFASLDVVCHFPLNMLIRNPELLNEAECKYAMNPSTHLDFLVYNRISKKPVLAIEVDGYVYHKQDTIQASRDSMKNRIMELYEIPLLRLKTNGSEEKEKIEEKLKQL